MHKMRKLNSSIDIIPLQGASNEEMSSPMGRSHMDEHHARIPQDPLIISRVQMYLYENEDKVYIDVNEMADSLQRKYRDYRMKKRAPFRTMVRRAYDEITECFSKKSDSLSRQDEDDTEVEIESDTPGNDVMNKEIYKMYKKNAEDRNGNSSDKELIDISSDDEAGKIEDIAPTKSRTPLAITGPLAKLSQKNTHSCGILKPPKVVTSTPLAKFDEPNQKAIDIPQTKISAVDKTRKRPREKTDESPTTLTKKKKDFKEISSEAASKAEVKIKFSDIGGNVKVLEEVCRLLVHIKHPEIFKQVGISPPRGFLLHGPPGCGKSLIAHAIAGELDIPLIKVAAPELIGGVSGESESRIRELFDKAVATAPCVLFLDEIDTIAAHRATAQKEMERRIVAQLLSCLDDLSVKDNGEKVLVLGATNRPDSLDPSLRRAGRFDREVSLGIPDKEARTRILEVHAAKLSLADDVDLMKIAALTPGFVGADLVALLREAASAAVNRVFSSLQNKEKIEVTEKQTENIEKQQDSVQVEQKIDEQKITDDNKENDTTKLTMDTEDNKEDKENEVTIPSITVDPPEEATTAAADTSSTVAEFIAASVTEVTPANATEPVQIDDLNNPTPSVSGINTNNVRKENDNAAIKPVEVKKTGNLENLLQLLHDKVPLPPEQLAALHIEYEDFDRALRVVQPSSKREGFATVPDVTWADIGSLQEIREELQMAILAPVKHSENFAAFGLNTPSGVLLCGPPGCGKTLLAKAIANEAEINFISVKGPELLNMYVGESERAVRQCFIRARNSAPCVIFFDELDALCPKRTVGDNSATSRVVNQLLTEMDGVEGRKDVYLMAATNRPDIIDQAVMRPGRFDKILYVGLPTPMDRVDILNAITKNGTKPKFASDVVLEDIAKSNKCDGYTGADLANLIRESSALALKESMINNSGLNEVHMRHFAMAFDKMRPSILEEDAKHYEKLKKLYTINKVETPELPIDVAVSPMETPDTPIDSAMNDTSIDPASVDTTMEAMET